jgi:hypothetical protein
MLRRLFVLVLVCTACNPDPYFGVQDAHVAFTTDAPFCGTLLVRAKIDNVVVFLDTISSGRTTKQVSIHSGSHVLSAQSLAVSNGKDTLTTYTWPDSTVNLNPLQVLTRTLPLYCS